ncbi:MAG: PQQ-dependent sugar dehydrogenase [Ferruginibacter sp.]
MNKGMLIISVAIMFLLYFSSCNSSSSPDKTAISSDPATIAKGEATFTLHCSTCHNFRQGGIGPQLGGLTDSVASGWIRKFIMDPKAIIESGDERARQSFKKYKVFMPSFTFFKDDEIDGIIAFLNTHKEPGQNMVKGAGKELSNPIPDTIMLSNLLVGLKLQTQMPPSRDSGKLPRARITKLDFEPHSGNSFILDLRGKLYRLQNNQPVVYMDMAKLKPAFIHEPGLGTGFGSFAFHPEFAKNGLLYTTHAEATGSGKADFAYADSIKVSLQWVLSEWKTEQPGAAIFSGKSRELFRANMVSVSHGVQEITFNPLAHPGDKDYGMLYIGIGDGGSVEEGYPFLANNRDKVWGSVLRIDPRGNNSANGQYGIPQDNPFVNGKDTTALGEIYAYGFRNPHRITWSRSGKMLVSNIGHGRIESLNLLMPGHDYGWPIREGTFVIDPYGDLNKVYPLDPNDSIYHITYPVAQYDHEGGWVAISGGYEYTGKAIPQLAGKFLFGDIASGRMFYIEMADVKLGKQAAIKEWRVSIAGAQKSLKVLSGNDQRVDLHFGRDARGELYILTKTDGKVYKIVSASFNEQ